MPFDPPKPAGAGAPPRSTAEARAPMSFGRALLIAVLLEILTVLMLVVNWRAFLPEPEPEPMKVEFVKLPEPPPPPPQREAPPPEPKQQPPKPEPPEEPPPPDDPPKLPEPKPPEPEPPPPPPRPEPPPPDLPPPDKKAPPVKKVPAVYPKDALAQGQEGQVRVRLTVSPAGKVIRQEVIESKPPGIFDYSALKATKGYVFPPGEEEFEIDQVIRYVIEDERFGPEMQGR